MNLLTIKSNLVFGVVRYIFPFANTRKTFQVSFFKCSSATRLRCALVLKVETVTEALKSGTDAFPYWCTRPNVGNDGRA